MSGQGLALLDEVGRRRPPGTSMRSRQGSFYFEVGADNRHIGSVDEAGVALAAIKALAAQNRRLNRKVVSQNERIARLERGLATLER